MIIPLETDMICMKCDKHYRNLGEHLDRYCKVNKNE